MTEENRPPVPGSAPKAERIAKVMARAGVASRRDAERIILEGRVTVNGQKIDSPALDVLPSDRVKIDGKPIEDKQETRLWLYYKPVGLVTSEKDEKGRQTVFDALPRDLPRVMSVGRLDLNSEGLLLLTNDGELKRRLELPSTGWLRRYRVRVNGQPNDLTFDPLRRGVTIDGEDFQPMEIKLDSQQGANAWLTVGIREGRNREIRRAMAHVGLIVNRLIRIGYGPFKLVGLEPNEVKEVKRRVLRDQLGGLLTGEQDEGASSTPNQDGRPFGARRGGGERDARKPYARREDGDRKPFARREDGDRKPFARREDGERKPYARREDGDRKPFARREDGDRKPFARREDGDRKPRSGKADGKPGDGARSWGTRPRGGDETGTDRKPRAKSAGFKSHGAKPEGGKSWGGKSHGDGGGSGRPAGSKPGDRPRSSFGKGSPRPGGKPAAPRPKGAGPQNRKPRG